jgi:hypothetical protein
LFLFSGDSYLFDQYKASTDKHFCSVILQIVPTTVLRVVIVLEQQEVMISLSLSHP